MISSFYGCGEKKVEANFDMFLNIQIGIKEYRIFIFTNFLLLGHHVLKTDWHF